jgi:acetyltransferase-like isoleucine patch superfamily enzyme
MKFRNTSLFKFLFKYSMIWHKYFEVRRSKFGYCAKSSRYTFPLTILGLENIFLYENTIIGSNTMIQATRAKFIMKKNSYAAEGLTIITGSHMSKVGEWFKSTIISEPRLGYHKDVIVEEDVSISTNVTILKGVKVGRGAIIGSGTVIRKSIPPYAIVMGNPAKIVGFKFRPDEVIEHEKELYIESERLSIEYLKNNYDKYFLRKIDSIKEFTKI